MDDLNLNKILNRESIAKNIKDILTNFEANKKDLLLKKGIYIYGHPGCGKTQFVMDVLKSMDYDIIKYDAGDIRNKSVIETITKNNISQKNVMSMFHKKTQKIAIVMDEIDGMNNGDKGGINTLIKLIRPKKTKKQKLEEITMNPIICIGNYYQDKKIKELMKVCNTIELKSPTNSEISNILQTIVPNIDDSLKQNIIKFIQGDLRKLNNFCMLYNNNDKLLSKEMFETIFQMKQYNDDTKQITHKLINNKFHINDHNTMINETDRTIVGLLWHENIVDSLGKLSHSVSIPLYLKLLENICLSDYIDRVTFQNQIWQFNEMSSIIKTFKNNKIYHDSLKKKIKYNPGEVRFTKVLTKYSTEYNNSLFIQDLCYQLGMDKKDLFSFFLDLKNKYENEDANTNASANIIDLFVNCEISKLDIQRMYRYIDKYIKVDVDEVDNNGDDESTEEVVL
jgi:DNA polymerase III delta prime subunit